MPVAVVKTACLKDGSKGWTSMLALAWFLTEAGIYIRVLGKSGKGGYKDGRNE